MDAGSHDTLEPGACLLKDAIVFGSGVKYSVAQLFRVGRPPVVYLGTDKLEWGLGDVAVRGAAHKEILYRVSGGGWKSYGSVIQMGQRDWNDLWMPIREFVSNALDEVGGNPAGVRVELTNKAPRERIDELGAKFAGARKPELYIGALQGLINEANAFTQLSVTDDRTIDSR